MLFNFLLPKKKKKSQNGEERGWKLGVESEPGLCRSVETEFGLRRRGLARRLMHETEKEKKKMKRQEQRRAINYALKNKFAEWSRLNNRS